VHVVFAEVVCITMDESVCTPELRVDPHALAPVGRMTFPWFVRARGDALFPLERVRYADHPLAKGGVYVNGSASGRDDTEAPAGWAALGDRPVDPLVAARAANAQRSLREPLERLRTLDPPATPMTPPCEPGRVAR
ncbi:MAG TPA: hypothetical protein VF183_07685, partial [Acidimicrobiales bacterium]